MLFDILIASLNINFMKFKYIFYDASSIVNFGLSDNLNT